MVVTLGQQTHLDLLSILPSGGKRIKAFGWDHRLQRQIKNLNASRPSEHPPVSGKCCFSHSAYWLPTRKTLLYTVANPACGLPRVETGKRTKYSRYKRGNGNGTESSKIAIIPRNKNKTKEDVDSCWLTACGCRGACITRND